MQQPDPQKLKTGYLREDFRMFYLRTREARAFAPHYHDFHKLLCFLDGRVSYYIEGEAYQLLPGDLVLVPAGEVHRPVIHSQEPYERLILYLSPAFFEQYLAQGCDLFRPFAQCRRPGRHILRISGFEKTRLSSTLQELIRSRQDDRFAADLYRRTLLLEALILLGRASEDGNLPAMDSVSSNSHIMDALSFINGRLEDSSLSVEEIAGHCFLNRSYLMHLFRQETGYTVNGYLTEKRLFLAKKRIQQGCSITDACMLSGFASYASFYRAYRKKFGAPPKGGRP